MITKNYHIDQNKAPSASHGFEVIETQTDLVVFSTSFRNIAEKRCSDLNKNRFGFNGFTPEYLLTPIR